MGLQYELEITEDWEQVSIIYWHSNKKEDLDVYAI